MSLLYFWVAAQRQCYVVTIATGSCFSALEDLGTWCEGLVRKAGNISFIIMPLIYLFIFILNRTRRTCMNLSVISPSLHLQRKKRGS